MTNIDEINTIEMVSTKGNVVYVTIMEQRPWSQIKDAKLKLASKIRNAKGYSNTDKFKRKYKDKRIIIEFSTIYEPPEDIKKLLKEEGIKLVLMKK